MNPLLILISLFLLSSVRGECQIRPSGNLCPLSMLIDKDSNCCVSNGRRPVIGPAKIFQAFVPRQPGAARFETKRS
jgi:hypothetical protein